MTQLYLSVLFQKKVTENSTQTGLRDKKLHRSQECKSRERESKGQGWLQLHISVVLLAGWLPSAGLLLRLAWRGAAASLKAHMEEERALLQKVLLRG